MSGKKKGNIADPELHSSESPAKDGNELKNRINETAKYSELFEKIDVDSDYDDILATYEKTLDKRTRAAMKKAGGAADEEESVDENVMIEADEIVSDADSAAQPEVQETAENKPAKKKEKVHNGDAGAVLYSYIAALGLATGTTFKKMLAKPKKLGRNIVGFFRYVFRFLWLGFKKFIHIISHTFVEQVKDFRRDVRSAMNYLRQSRHKPKTLFPILGHYVKKAFTTHTQMFKTIANFALPVAAVLAFVLTVNYWSSVTFALKVSYDNKELGYISDESVYNEAQSAAKARMTTTKTDSSAKLDDPTYELSLVSVNKLVDSSILCDRIIENSESNVTNACGIYIDDEFICSVKNETDAASVFNAILEKHKVTDSNSFVDFVEKVEYVQGLYPDDPKTMWDASKLKKQLEQTKQAKKTWETNFIGIERYSSVLLRALQKREELEIPNIYFMCVDAKELGEIFAPGEVEKIYLNFSDPWPKDRHAKRRLTSPDFMKVYDQVLAKDGRVEFKTDNQDLFTYSLEAIPEAGWTIEASTRDLHHSDMAEGNVMTEYETKFSAMGNPICKLVASR